MTRGKGTQPGIAPGAGNAISEMPRAGRLVLGLDPGETTGVANYIDGKLQGMQSIKPWGVRELLEMSIAQGFYVQVVFEDSRLQSHIFSADKKRKKPLSEAAKLKVARDVGGIDAWCTLIEESCRSLSIPCIGVSPADKGGKVAASAFEHITGWAGRTNEHERDAAMVARPFRKGFQQ